MEFAARAVPAVHPYTALHQFYQALRNAQTQAGAAVEARCGFIGLLKGFENRRCFVRRNADAGVPHHKVEHQAALLLVGPRPDCKHDFAMLGKFDRISYKIGNDLA